MSYWLTLVDEGFVLVVPGGLMVLVSSTVLGVLLVRAGSRPRLTSWLVLGAPVLVLAASSAVSLGAAFVSQAVAWGLAGWRVWLSAGEPGDGAQGCAAVLATASPGRASQTEASQSMR
ncbi:MAG TPA: hypothetical protein VK908_08565 [Jiangellales bacterium]|nr:hypothetical protein [Jiangellales bacterium]